MGSFWKKVRQVAEDGTWRFSRKRLQDREGARVSQMSGGRRTPAEHRQDLDLQTNGGCGQTNLARAEREPTQLQNQRRGSVGAELPDRHGEAPERTAPKAEVEVIKVYLDNRPVATESARMLTDEVSQIQEVRYCLKTLREQMAARQSSNGKKSPANGLRVNLAGSRQAVAAGNAACVDSGAHAGESREEAGRPFVRLKDVAKKHREEEERLQSQSDEYSRRLAEQSQRLQRAEEQSRERGQRVEELQRLLASVEAESGVLKDKMAAGEAELQQLRADNKEERGKEKEQRCAELEKEVATLKEKIHHLDDMLKSQQRKVRHMIEQLQNSRTVLQERDRVIRDLEEKVAFLEAENREMHDHMEYFLSGQDPPPLTSSENKPQVIYSKPLTPTSTTSKALPFIKVIEIKS